MPKGSADALVASANGRGGARADPLGHGSPNTVMRMLDLWHNGFGTPCNCPMYLRGVHTVPGFVIHNTASGHGRCSWKVVACSYGGTDAGARPPVNQAPATALPPSPASR